MATYSLIANQILGPIPITRNSLVRVTPASGATAEVEYSKSQTSSIYADSATWAYWPKGTVSSTTEDIVNRECFLRVTALSGAVTVAVEENAAVTDILDDDWKSSGINVMPASGHVAMVLLGDSITNRTVDAAIAAAALPMCSFWNWGNWLCGSPFVYEHIAAISGDLLPSTLSRVSYIPDSVEAVGIASGINDVVAFSSSSTQAQIDAKYVLMTGQIETALDALSRAGKKTILCTIPPNNGFNSSTDSRIQLLDRVNAYIRNKESDWVFIADIFTALWDSAQPTLRVFSAGVYADATHPNNNGSQIAGSAVKQAFVDLYGVCSPNRDLYAGFQPMQTLYGNFRSGTGGTAPVKTNGTGNLADGWRSINNAGTAVFTMDNTTLYTKDTTMVGPWVNTPIGPEEYWQLFAVSSAIANDNPRLRWVTIPTDSTASQIEGVFGGDEFFMEIEIYVTDNVNLRDVTVSITGFFTEGTSPVDQSYMGAASIITKSGNGTSYSMTDAITDSSYRIVLRTPVLRIPENINNASAVSFLPSIDMIFAGNGSANIWFARPRVWHRCEGRLG
jgi:lysophospholipase L1-like esterase